MAIREEKKEKEIEFLTAVKPEGGGEVAGWCS